MKKTLSAGRGPAVAAVALLACLLPAPGAGAARAGTAGHVRHLAGLGSRVPGYPGHRAAADYIEKHFRALGLEGVTRDTFTEVVPFEAPGETYMTHEGRVIPLAALEPNSARTSMTPAQGLAGPLVWGGDGDLANYEGQSLEGAVVLLEFNSGARWREAAMLGAAAIVFVAPRETTRFEASRKKVPEIPFDMPRFYLDRAGAETLFATGPPAGEAVIFCRQEWRAVQADNIFARLPGRDPELDGAAVVLSAHYDSSSIVPAIAPGAEQAAGIAALLELAEYFSRHRPRRPVIFLAVGSHHQSLRGIGDFVNRRWRTIGVVSERAPEPLGISIFLGLELSSRSKTIGLHHNREGVLEVQRHFAPFAARFLGFVPGEHRGHFLNLVTPERGLGLDSVQPERIKTDGFLATQGRLPAVSLLTVHDPRATAGTPLDRPEGVYFDNLDFQAALIRRTLAAAMEDPEMVPEVRTPLRDNLNTLRGRIVHFEPASSFVPDLPGALAFVSIGAPETFGYFLTDGEGFFQAETVPHGGRTITAYRTDPRDGRVVMAPDLGVNGAENYPVRLAVDSRFKEWMIVLFNSLSTNVHDLVDPRYLRPVTSVELLDKAGSVPTAYGVSHYQDLAVIHTDPGMSAKIIGASGLLGKRFLLIGAVGEDGRPSAEGRGYRLSGRPDAFTLTPYRAAADMTALNGFRLRNLARHGITSEQLKEIHELAAADLAAAGENLAAGQWRAFLVNSRRALSWQARAYPDIRDTTVDIIKGLIFYFLIMLPFAFFTERLVFGYPDIRRQITALSGVFLLIYAALRLVHPGFRLAEAPEMILLGFIIFTLSGLVTALLAAKFEDQMKRMTSKTRRLYQTDISRASATSSAFALGIANMKRRKLRTVLTSVTLVLLTFTVISFTSVRHFLRYNRVTLPHEPSYRGLMIRDRAWEPVAAPYHYLLPELAGAGPVVPRAWYTHRELDKQVTLPVAYRDRATNAGALLGLSAREPQVSGLDRTLLHGRWFEDDDEPAAIIGDETARALGFPPGETGRATIRVLGEELAVVGIFSTGEMDLFRDLDGGRLSPVDFATMPGEERRRQELEEKGELESRIILEGMYQHQPFAGVVIVPSRFLLRRNGVVRSFAARPDDGEQLQPLVEGLAARLALTIFSGDGERGRIYSSIGMVSLTGTGNLFIPILIASLIVLNTMLGSVYERIREIGIYSSVGLAPSHISALFFAEACVYAILGAVGGYLLGQAVAGTLAATGALRGLTLNYSSVSAVSSTLVVMATVFASTIFPARQASRLSVPDVTRQWEMPEPEGLDWHFDFPFTVSDAEVAGLTVFLKDYFDSFAIDSVGVFYTWDTRFEVSERDGRRHYGVSCRMHLAPFDLGIRQQLALEARPVAGVGFCTIKVLIRWLSGDRGDWKRVNRRLLNDLRRQFLVWRTIAPGTKAEYAARALEDGREPVG